MILGQFCASQDQQSFTEYMLKIGILDMIKSFFDNANITLIQASLWTISNIACECPAFALQVSKAPLFTNVTDCVLSSNKNFRQQAIQATLNTLGTVDPTELELIFENHPNVIPNLMEQLTKQHQLKTAIINRLLNFVIYLCQIDMEYQP